jgi:hypothetical protein
VALALAAALLLGACTPRRLMVGELTAAVAAGLTSMEAEADLETTEAALPAQIKLLEGLLASAPQDRSLLLLLARLLGGYTFVFLDGRLDDGTPALFRTSPEEHALAAWADRLNRKGADYARVVLALRHPAWGASAPELSGAQLQALAREDAPALFWYGLHLGSLAARNPEGIAALELAGRARRAMERVLELEPTTQHGAAHLLLMVDAARSPLLGGDPARAEAHYRSLKAIAGEDYRMADLFYARHLLHLRQDRAAFERVVQAIIAQPADGSRHGLQNAAAARRAARYLERIGQWFDA